MNTSVNQRILGQILFWSVLFLGIPYLIMGNEFLSKHIVRASMMTSGVIIMTVLNLKFLFPRFYINGNFPRYIIFTIITTLTLRILYTFLLELGGFYLLDEMEKRIANLPFQSMTHRKVLILNIFGGAIKLFVATVASTLYEVSIVMNRSAKEAALLKSEKLEAELKFLKSQINPHFLFNSLNNIYTLTVLDPSQAGDNLLKLSEMLRYLLYECDAEKVALGRELTYLQNYIDLFSLKDEEALNIVFEAQSVQEEVMIAPLLFIPFVENAFKHSQIEDLENGWIQIKLSGNTETIHFDIKNSIPEVAFSKDGVGGIGLQNVKRQLELLYPKKHELTIETVQDTFSVQLTIHLTD